MNPQGHDTHAADAAREGGAKPVRSWRFRLGFWLFLGIAAFYLVTEHRAHLIGGLTWLPLLLLAACPLLHVFGHGRHGGHGGHGVHRPPPPRGGDLP